MTISFSGLASGLDTSSWVESLVALKQAKVTELEEEKDLVTTTREALSNIKSFFTSFRSVLEKVTDTKFNVGSMDIFAQNLATSSNAAVLSAIATAEAAEASYEISVDKLATQTQAVSGHKYTTSIVSTTMATSDTKLINLGVKAGNIGVNVNGVEVGVTITENDTIQTFIDKLKNIGVNASFNNETGIFNANLSVNDINDKDGTGIVQALHLEGVNEGYQSGQLQVTDSETTFSPAEESTLLKDLGVKAGTLTIEANDAVYNVEIDEATTLGELIQALRDENISATLDEDGTFRLEDAVITNDGTTNLIDAFGLKQEVNNNVQQSGDLSYKTVVTEVTEATLDTLLNDIVEAGVKDGDTVIVKNSDNEISTIQLTSTSTLGDLFDGLKSAGLNAELNNDGTVTISGGIITGGSLDIVDEFGLTSSPLSGIVTGNPLTETIVNEEIASSDTKLVEDLGVKAGYLQVTNSNGGVYYEKISEGMTIGDLINDYAAMGISASIDADTGVLTITGGTFTALSDSEVQNLVNTGAISETNPDLIQGTDLLSKLYGADNIPADHITPGSAHSKSESLKYEVTGTVEATLTTTLHGLGLADGDSTATFETSEGTIDVTLNSDMTIQDMIDYLDSKGITASFDETTSKLTINGARLVSSNTALDEVFGFTSVVSGKYNTSNPVYVVVTEETEVDLDSTLGDIGFTGAENFTLTINGTSYTTTMSETTTFGQLISWVGRDGVTVSLEDGVFKLEGATLGNAQFEALVGLETTTSTLPQSFTMTSSEKVTYSVTSPATGTTTLGALAAANGGWKTINNNIPAANATIDSAGTITSQRTPGRNIVYISTAAELTSMSGKTYYNTDFYLTSDVTILPTAWKGINLEGSTFNGQGHVITMNGTTAEGGLFNSVMSDSTVSNLVVAGTLSRTTTSSRTYVGGVVDQLDNSSIEDVISAVNLNIVSSDVTNIGGLVGQASYSNILRSEFSGSLGYSDSSGRNIYIGGLIGYMQYGNTISDNMVLGSISLTIPASPTRYSYVGGLTGCIASGTGIAANTVINNFSLNVPSQGTYRGSLFGFISSLTIDSLVEGNIGNGTISIAGTIPSSATGLYESIYASNTEITSNYGAYAEQYGWDDSIWNLSGDVPTLRRDWGQGSRHYIDVYASDNNSMQWKERITVTSSTTLRDLINNINDNPLHGIPANGIYETDSTIYVGNSYITDLFNASPTHVGNLTFNTQLSSSQTIQTEATLTEDTTLTELGLTNTTTVQVLSSEGSVVESLVFNPDATISEVFSSLSGYGFTGSVSGGKAYIESTQGNTLSGELVNALKLTIPTSSSSSARLTTGAIKPNGHVANTTTKLSAFASQCDFVVTFKSSSTGASQQTYTFAQDATFQDLIDVFGDKGINVTMRGGVLSFDTSEGVYAEGAVLDRFGVKVSVSSSGYVGIGQTSSSTVLSGIAMQTYANLNTTFADLGIDPQELGSGSTLIKNNSVISGNYVFALQGIESLTSETTIGEFFDFLDDNGYTGTLVEETTSVSGRSILNLGVKMVITSNTGNTYLTGALMDALGIDWASTNGASDWISDAAITYVSGQATVTQPGNTGTEVDNPIFKPADPTFSIIPQSTNSGISTMSVNSALGTGEEDSFGNFVRETTPINGTEPELDPSNPVFIGKTATSSTTLGTLGVTSTQTITLTTTSGSTLALTFSKTDTIGTIVSKLNSHGIDASFSNGKITIASKGSGSYSVDKISTQLADALNLPTSSPTGIADSVSSSLLPGITETLEITSESSLAMVTNRGLIVESYTVVIGKTDGGYSTITFSSTKTIDDFVSELNSNGVNASWSDSTHKLTIGSGGNYIYSMSTKLADGFNIEIGEDSSYKKTSSGEMSDSSTLVVTNTPSTTPVSQTSTKPLTKTVVSTETVSMSTKLSDLVDSSGNNLGITAGQIYVYKDGVRNIVNISTDDTLESLSNKLSPHNISIGLGSDNKLYFNGNGNSYMTTDGLTSNVSNILDKLGIDGNWSTTYDTVSKPLVDNQTGESVATGDAKLVDLLDSNGSLLGITAGTYYIYENGVRTTATITENTTVADFLAELNMHGISANIGSDGSISLGGQNNSYITSSNLGNDSNIVDVLFPDWQYVNTYTSDPLLAHSESVQNITLDTKLADIDGVNYEEGYITVNNNGVKTNIQLTADETIGTLINKLSVQGFDAAIDQNGSLIIKSQGGLTLEDYTGSGNASNALEILGIDSANWINTNIYESSNINEVEISTIDTAVTRDTKLSELGITSGEYYIYNNGVRYTAMVSVDDTLDSFIQTLATFGIQASLIQDGDKSVLKLLGNGDSYIAKSNSAASASNIVDKLFPNDKESSYNYTGALTQTITTTSTDNINEDTLLSKLDSDWGGSKLKSEGSLVFNVNGETRAVVIEAGDTIGDLITKLDAVGISASVKDGIFTIQSGFDELSINSAASTSNLMTNLGLTFHDDMGGYSASSDTVMATTTIYEERTRSAANYADDSTKLSDVNISSGSLSIFKDGQKSVIQVDAEETFGELRTRVNASVSGVDLKFENGILTFFATDGSSLEIGTTTDTSNLTGVAGLTKQEDGTVASSREMYKVNQNSVLTQSGLFTLGDVTEGTFTIGNAVFTINKDTTMNSLISQINSSEDSNATAYWDSIDGRLVITSRATGESLINIEAGTSNFTDIMGFTTSETKADGSVIKRLAVDNQTLGSNASFTINGTRYTSTSNTVTSDISRIEGVTLNLKDVTESGTVTLTIEKDKEVVADAIEDVINAYNELMSNVNDAISIEGDLHSETTLKLIRTQLRNLMTGSGSANATFRNLDSIGISFEAASGTNVDTENIDTLYFDKEKFLEAYAESPSDMKDFLVGDEAHPGVLSKVEELIESTLASVTGYFDSADNSFETKIKRIDDQISRQTRAVERYRIQLESKFQSMDMLIANMQNQYSSFLSL